MELTEFNEKMEQVAKLAAEAAAGMPLARFELVNKTDRCWVFRFVSMHFGRMEILCWLDKKEGPQFGINKL